MSSGLIGFAESVGDGEAAALGGLAIGLLYGVSAQVSRFCLRASIVEFWRGAMGPRLAVWLLAFSTALLWVQSGVALEVIDLGESRWRGAAGSISGALIGGALFGVGMIMAKGCPGRLLVLAGGGNLRALLAGLVFAVAAQATLHGLLSPLRDAIAGAWVTAGPNPGVLDGLGVGAVGGAALGLCAAAVALGVAFKNRVSWLMLVAACGVGFAAAAGWWFTSALSTATFEPTPVESLTFSGPSADMLMVALSPFDGAWDFDIGLIPGVFIGAAVSAALFGEWKLEGFVGSGPMLRQLTGAALMGAGAMLSGGCAIGAGVSGASALALTAWIALTTFWLSAGLADRLIDTATPAAAGKPAAA